MPKSNLNVRTEQHSILYSGAWNWKKGVDKEEEQEKLKLKTHSRAKKVMVATSVWHLPMGVWHRRLAHFSCFEFTIYVYVNAQGKR